MARDCHPAFAAKLVLFAAFLLGLAAPVEAQRHPESAGASAFYRPGVTPQPDWLLRPPFKRGPLDRYERGSDRLFLNTGDQVPYLNYANDHYILWDRQTQAWFPLGGRPDRFRNVRWDRVGNYMGGGYRQVFALEETRSGSDNSGFSLIDHRGLTMRIGHYTYKRFHWTVTAGDDVRTKFTPLTLSQSHLALARLDVDYLGKDRITLLYNRGREDLGLFTTWGARVGDDLRVGGQEEQDAPVLMYGLHWQHTEGEFLNFGGTFLNQLLAFPSSPRSSAFRGDLPYNMLGPRIIRVFVTDDSPDELRTSARVYDIDIIIEGEQDEEPVQLSSVAGDPNFDPSLEPIVSGGQPVGDGNGREVVGRDVVTYEFTLPAEITANSVRFAADVEGDYQIGVRQIHDFPSVDRNGNPRLVESEWPAVAIGTEGRRPFKWYTPDGQEPYFTVVRSEGNGSGGANRKIVTFDYGMPTGQSLASFNWDANLVGLKLSGEISHNLQNFMYPIGDNQGARSSERSWAYWFQGMKELAGGLELGGELYRLEPDYSGGYDSLRGGLPFHSDVQSGTRIKAITQEYDLVEDNDDDDQWPDDFLQEVPAIGNEYPGWPNAQVFPGLDFNSDSMSDVDRNENFILDWQEAFMTYDADPREFVYGIDFNNNSIPDFRENDDLPDYPYRRDQKGTHVFLRFNKLGFLGESLTLGTYQNEQIAGGGKAEALYLRYALNIHRPGRGFFRINYDIKKVEDDIADHSFIFFVPPDDADIIPWLNRPDTFPEIAGVRRPATPDLLVMRDSWVNTLFVNSSYVGIDDVNVENMVLWERNSQAEIGLPGEEEGLLQEENVISRWGVVNKIDYTWERGAFSFSPKFKHRFLYESEVFPYVDRSNNMRRSFSDFIPILTANYKLTANTSFMAGAQGFPLLPYKHWDRADKNETFDQRDYVAMMRLNSEYFGRALSYFFGYQITDREYSRLKSRNTETGTLFAELVVPF